MARLISKYMYTQGQPKQIMAVQPQAQITAYPEIQFLTLEPRFVRKGCRGGCKIAILRQFLTLEPQRERERGSADSNIRVVRHLVQEKKAARQARIFVACSTGKHGSVFLRQSP